RRLDRRGVREAGLDGDDRVDADGAEVDTVPGANHGPGSYLPGQSDARQPVTVVPVVGAAARAVLVDERQSAFDGEGRGRQLGDWIPSVVGDGLRCNRTRGRRIERG